MAQNQDPRVSATPPSRWTIMPLFYSQSTDFPVLRGRRCVRGALNWPQTGELYNKFTFQALRLRVGPANRLDCILHCSETQRCSARLVGLETTGSCEIGAPDPDLRPSARVPSPWTLTRSFVPSTTDLRELQIKMFTSRAWAAKSTLLIM